MPRGGRKLHDGLRRLALEGDLVDRREQRQLLAEAVLVHHRPDLLRRERALQLLAPQQLTLDLLPGLGAGRAHEGLRALAVAAAEAGGDEVGHTATLKESAVLHTRMEVPDEGAHLLEADADHRSLGVATVAEPIAEPCSQRYNVLQGPAELHACNIVDRTDAEVRTVKNLDERGLVCRRSIDSQRRLTELALRNLTGHIGSHEHRHVVAEQLPEDV
mmetsp:Transcript_57491/g.173840  ORF Transcript_57491/g.173840 Transcript_57491/m.173840 type:complete len:217 (+) Transcript_57491:167-817(+)